MTRSLRLHAIYLCLGDSEFLEPSIRSIYDHVDGITIFTAYDRDWNGRAHQPDDLIARIVGREFDPDRKINLLVGDETNEARARNRAMDCATLSCRSRRVRRQNDADGDPAAPDYFLIVDPDEVYEGDDVRRLADYASRRRLPVYRVAGARYFKRWNYRVDGLEWSCVLIRADWRLNHIRNWLPPLWRRVVSRVPIIPASLRSRVRLVEDIPAEHGVFHHGSYVGPRARIVAKVASSTHGPEMATDWLTSVYDTWTLASRNFNPAYPELYPSARQIPIGELPEAVREHAWPPEYLDTSEPFGDRESA
jgi:hypothetical protein